MKEKKRYFLAFYKGTTDTGYCEGYMDFTTKGGFINKVETHRMIKEKFSNIKDLTITNVLELKENDYKDWILK